MVTVPFRERLRMSLLVTLACAGLAIGLRFYLSGTGGSLNYAERQLRAAVAAEAQEVHR